MSKAETDEVANEEQDIARLLRAAGPREELPEALKSRWEQKFREELELRKNQRRQHRNIRFGGLAASIIAVAIVTLLNFPTESIAPHLVSVTSVSGDTRILVEENSEQMLDTGQLIPADATIITGSTGFTAIRYGAYDLRVKDGSRLQLHSSGITLEFGQIYLSDEGKNALAQSLSVNTPFGTVTDIGTQFTVSVNAAGVTSKVRKGALKVTTPFQEFRTEAGPHGAKEISFNGGNEIQVSDIVGTGANWEWIYQATPTYSLEGQSVDNFLQWSSGESGMIVEYFSENAAIYAQTETLHGDILGLNPDAAVERVLASTYLKVDRIPPNILQVSLQHR